ncbi:MAG: TetR family transcriptional regulator [Pseudomonadota bacterium]
MARSTKEDALETRSRILDAAEDVFYEKGVSRTSLADVALASDVTRGAIYWHFKNKSDVFEAMCERIRLPMEAMVEATAGEGVSDPLSQLRKTVVFFLQQAATNPHSRKVLDIIFLKCEFGDAADPIRIREHECYVQGLERMQRILDNAIAMKQLPPDLDTRLAAIAIHAMVIGLIKNWLFSPASFDLAKDAEKLIDAHLDTLRNAPSLRRS